MVSILAGLLTGKGLLARCAMARVALGDGLSVGTFSSGTLGLASVINIDPSTLGVEVSSGVIMPGCYLEADVRRNKRKMGGFASWEIFGTGFEILIFCGFPATYRFQNFGFFRGFLQFLEDPKNSQNADFSAVSQDFEGWARPKILCGFSAMNRAQNLDFPAVSCDF